MKQTIGIKRFYAKKHNIWFSERTRPKWQKSRERLVDIGPIQITNTRMELLYGPSPVLAAIKQGRREIFGLYVQGEYMGDEQRRRIEEIIDLARQQDINMLEVRKDQLSQAIGNQNHQGIALKATRLEGRKLKELGSVESNGRYTAKLNLQEELEQLVARRKVPLYLAIDGIQDERNLGAITRTALFFGADAVLLGGVKSCNPTAHTSKASSGAMECIPIYRLFDDERVLKKCQKNGWQLICASTSPQNGYGSTPSKTMRELGELDKPTILMMGSEGEGISDHITKMSDMNVHIPVKTDIPEYIDSLNVSVAAGILLSSIKFAGE